MQNNIRSYLFTLIVVIFAFSCGQKTPEKIDINKDACHYCKMSIADQRFAAEIVTQKSKVFKFDDALCLSKFLQNNKALEVKDIYISNYEEPYDLILAKDAFFISHENLKSPMGGNSAAFKNKNAAKSKADMFNTPIKLWDDIFNTK